MSRFLWFIVYKLLKTLRFWPTLYVFSYIRYEVTLVRLMQLHCH